MSAECSAVNILPGYRQTEVGVIPEDWDVKLLGSLIIALEAGVSVNSVEKEKDTYAHNASIMKTSCVIRGKFIPEEHKTIVPHEIHRAKLNPRKDSIVISRMNTKELVSECGYVDQDYTNLFLPDRLWMTRHNSRMPHCVRWLAHFLSSNSFNHAIKDSATGTSGSMKNISKESVLAVCIPFPPRAEQEVIADALSDADALIESLEQLIAKKRQIKQGAMQELLTGKKRLPEFVTSNSYKQTEVGVIPEDWNLRTLGELVTFLDGKRRPVKDADRAKMRGSIPYYGASGIVDYVNDYLFDEDLILLGEDGENILSRSCRLAFRISGKTWVNNHAHVLRPNPDISIGFLTDYLESLNYEQFNSGTAQPKLNKQTCLNILIALPLTKNQIAGGHPNLNRLSDNYWQ